MRKVNLILSLAVIAIAFLSSCNKSKAPDIIVDFNGANSGWYGDTIKFDITIDSKEAVSLNITNDNNDESYSEDYASGTASVEYKFIIPAGLEEGDKIKVTFVATNRGETTLSKTVEKEITLQGGGSGVDIIHTGTITEDETWYANDNHYVEGTLYLEGNTVTIEPGTIIRMKSGAEIRVGSNADASTTLIAEGTADQPITFTSANASPVAGDWDYITFDEGTNPSTSLKYCVFEYGGGYASYSGMIVVYGNTDLSMDYCTIRYSESNGIVLNDDDSRFSSFTNNAISDIAFHPISLKANSADCIGTDNTITTSGIYGIEVKASTMSKSNATWKAQTCPYVINGTVYVQNSTGAELTIEAGSTVSFTQGSEIDVSSSDFGTLIANGTSANPITFTSANVSPEAGDWDGIFLYEGTTNASFNYCTFEYGGGYASYSGIIVAYNCDVSINNSTIKHSEAYGIVMNDAASFVSFSNNTMSDIASEFIEIEANAVDGIGVGNDFQSTFSNKGIKIVASTMDKTASTWLAQNAPYIINGTVYVQSTSGATLTISAGTTVSFANSGEIDVASTGYGKIVAVGTAGNEITFTSAAPAGNQGAGDWDGIFLYDGTSNETIFDHCVFEYGGGYASYSALVYMGSGIGTSTTITNSLFQYSESNGISYDATDNPIISGNSFNNIAGENINVR